MPNQDRSPTKSIMENELEKTRLSDHDLLIELRTEMRGLRTDVKELRDGTSDRLTLLEHQKMDKDEVRKLKEEADELHQGFEVRLRSIEDEQNNFKGKYAIIGAVGMLGLSIFASWFVPWLSSKAHPSDSYELQKQLIELEAKVKQAQLVEEPSNTTQ